MYNITRKCMSSESVVELQTAVTLQSLACSTMTFKLSYKTENSANEFCHKRAITND